MNKRIKVTKLVSLVLVALTIVFCFVGCTAGESTNAIASSGSSDVTPEASVGSFNVMPTAANDSDDAAVYVGMERVLSDEPFYYYRDVTTDVMYVVYRDYRCAGLNVMVDPNTDGPLTHENWLKYQSEQ